MLNNSNKKIAKLRNLHSLICSTKFLNKKYILCEAKAFNENLFISKESRENTFLNQLRVKCGIIEFFSVGMDILNEIFCFEISRNKYIDTKIQMWAKISDRNYDMERWLYIFEHGTSSRVSCLVCKLKVYRSIFYVFMPFLFSWDDPAKILPRNLQEALINPDKVCSTNMLMS